MGICLLLFSSLIALGQVIFSIGLSIKSWPVIFLGRLVFGFGGESFTVANSALLAGWFKGKELAFAFGINLSISKLGSVINNVVSPALASRVGIIFAMWFGAMLCGVGVLCVLITIPLDRSVDATVAANKQTLALATAKEDDEEAEAEYVPSFRDVWRLQHVFWVLVVSCVVVYGCVLPFNNISSSLLLERDYFRPPPDSCHLLYDTQCESATNPAVDCPSTSIYQPPLPTNVSLSDVDCSDSYWSDTCTVEYCNRLGDAESEASLVMSIPYLISAALSPPAGFLIDRYGYRAVIALVAPLVLIVVHLYMGLTKVNAIGPLVGQGLAYTGFVSVLWPAIPLVVDEEMTGLAFGIVTSMQNLACALIPLIVASLFTDSGDRYIPNVELLFVGLACIGALVGVYLNYYDCTHGHLLNSPFVPDDQDLDNLDQDMVSPLLPSTSDNTTEVHNVVHNSTTSGNDTKTIHFASGADTVTGRTSSAEPGRHYSSEHRQARHSRNGSFSTYEEITRAGVFRTSGHHLPHQ